LGTISLGPIVALVGLFGALLLLTQPSARTSASLGLFAGAGAVCLLVAVLNSQRRAGGHLDPIPWLVIGIVLVAIPLIYYRTKAKNKDQ
jgi:hypothetical protein